jgi:hypothetical protein
MKINIKALLCLKARAEVSTYGCHYVFGFFKVVLKRF